jgi:integrase
MGKEMYNIGMEKVHLLKRKSKKRGSYYIAAIPYPGGIPGYQKMIILKDDDGNTTGNPATARKLLQNLKTKDKERRKAEESLKAYLGGFWAEDSAYVSKKLEDGQPRTAQYVAQSAAVIRDYFLPWAASHNFYTLRQLKKKDMTQWRSDSIAKCKAEGIGTAQVNKCRLALNVAFAEAVDADLMDANPLAGVKKAGEVKGKREAFTIEALKASEEEGKRPAYTVEELKKLFAIEWPNNKIKTAAMMAAYLGMRIGEIQGSLFDNIHFDTGKLDVLTQWQEGCKVGLCAPKCKSIRLGVEIPPPVLARLLALKASSNGSGLVFLGKAPDVPIKRSVFRVELNKALKAAGIARPGLCFHSFRHSWVSIASEAIGLDAASEAIGHADVQVSKRYRHVSEAAKAKAAKAVAKALG